MSNQLWSLSWSKKQNCFHIEPLSDLVKHNVRAFAEGGVLNDYHPVCIGSREECEVFSRTYRSLLREREKLQQPYVI